VEKIDEKRRFLIRPQPEVHFETNVAMPIVGQVLPIIRELQLRRLMRTRRYFSSLFAQGIKRKILRGKPSRRTNDEQAPDEWQRRMETHGAPMPDIRQLGNSMATVGILANLGLNGTNGLKRVMIDD
jgi:hypothetical protein